MTNLVRRRLRTLAIAMLIAAGPLAAWSGAQTSSPAAPPELTFDELVTLSKTDSPDPELSARLQRLLDTPVVTNPPSPTSASHPSRTLHVTEWNIARGENLDAIVEMLDHPAAFVATAKKVKKLSAADVTRLRDQMTKLRNSDVILLNEVDLGVKRTDYRDVLQELARRLKMSSAYAVEFVEVDPLLDLGTEAPVLDTADLSTQMKADLQPDPARFRGLHVNGILSRYPLNNVHVIALPVCHDWYADERRDISQLEKAKRKAANLAFLERIAREVRRGNRNAMTAEITLPGVAGPIHLVNVHLENKCKSGCRKQQMETVLHTITNDQGPVIVSGDLNTTGADGTPTSVRYELLTRVKDYQFWANTLLSFTPVGLPAYATAPFNFWKNYRDPTATHIPILGSNPEAALFSTVKQYRFADEGGFDFAGAPARNLEHSSKTLSDSNQRGGKGFAPTFSMKRDFGGTLQYRLDWFFVKPPADAITRFLPRNPQTLTLLNNASEEPLSDHAPITVTLPLQAKQHAGASSARAH